MHIESLYRYPVKGLTPEPLNGARLTPGRCLPWDRAFALAQGDAALEVAADTPRDKRRFRANIYIEDIEPWAEFAWMGRYIRVGETVMEVQESIDRCAATTVNPDTAERDANPVKELQQHFGHVELGVFATVVQGGEIKPDDEIALLD